MAKLKIINNSEYKKEVEINPPEKEKVGKELQLKNEEKHNFISLNSDNLEAPAPANQIKNTNSNGALAPRRGTIVSNNILEEDNMCMGGSKPKKKEPQLNVSNGRQNPNDLNNSFEYPNVNKKAFNAMGTKVNGIIDKKINDNNKQYEQKFQEFESRLSKSEDNINKLKEDAKETNKKVDKLQEEQIDLKAMLAEMKEERKDTKRMLEDMKQQTKWMAELFGKKISKETNKPKSNKDENRGNNNRSRENNFWDQMSKSSGLFHINMNMDDAPKPKMEKPDVAHDHNNEY